MVDRPVLKWFGGKWKMAPWITSHFPQHRIYVESFGGAASVLLRKPRAKIEIYNDLDDEVVNLFRVLRNHEKAQKLLSQLSLTPYSYTDFQCAYKPTSSPVERARRLIIRSMMGFGSRGAFGKTGFRRDTTRPDVITHWAQYPSSLKMIIDRFKGVAVESMDALKVMKYYDSPTTLHYVDPPYVTDTRASKDIYRHEFTNDDHKKLIKGMKSLKGMVFLSGYSHPIYSNLLEDWHRKEATFLSEGNSRDDTSEKRKRVEVLWINDAGLKSHRRLF